jgi:hypothetical protein
MMQEGCNRVGCSVASVPMYIGCVSLCYSKGELYICRPQKPSGSNLLDEPLKDFIVIPGYLPCSILGSHDTGHMGIMTYSESVQPLQSVKLL